jgi:hypothetical protein
MSIHQVIGIDPGLVHTGTVLLRFDIYSKRLGIWHVATSGLQPHRVLTWLQTMNFKGEALGPKRMYIEAYRPRQRLNSDVRMVQGEREFKRTFPEAQLIPNMGVLKVVRQPLLELLGLWSFTTPTHHQDLRSAARVALLGMMKEPVYNHLLSEVVFAHLNGVPWDIRHY